MEDLWRKHGEKKQLWKQVREDQRGIGTQQGTKIEKYLSCPSGCRNVGLCFTTRLIQVCEKLCCTSDTDPPTESTLREQASRGTLRKQSLSSLGLHQHSFLFCGITYICECVFNM